MCTLIGTGAVVLLIWFGLVAAIGSKSNAQVSTHMALVSGKLVAASPTATSVAPSNSNSGLNPTIVAALIGLGGVE